MTSGVLSALIEAAWGMERGEEGLRGVYSRRGALNKPGSLGKVSWRGEYLS